MSAIFHPLLVLFLNLILLFYRALGNNLGMAIIAITLAVNLILMPVNKRAMEMAKKQQALKPELDKLNEKYKGDKETLIKEQTKLFKDEGFNPAMGCLPMIVQLVVFIILFQAFRGVLSGGADAVANLNKFALWTFLKLPADHVFNTQFLIFDLAKNDVILLFGKYKLPGILVISAAVMQFLASKVMMPTIKAEETSSRKTATKSDDVAADMQKQMAYILPLLTLWIGMAYASGICLYFLVTSAFSVLRYKQTSGKVKGGRG